MTRFYRDALAAIVRDLQQLGPANMGHDRDFKRMAIALRAAGYASIRHPHYDTVSAYLRAQGIDAARAQIITTIYRTVRVCQP